MRKNSHEEFARFFENPSREALRDLLKRNFGEANQLDFKEEWPSFPKVARHILGMANSGGGCLVIGVSQDEFGAASSKGLEAFQDKATIQKGVQKYLPQYLIYECMDFAYSDSEYPALVGKKFQVVIVEDKPRYLPFVSVNDGEGIRVAAVYVRRGTNTEEANYTELQQIINRRLETDYSTQSEFNMEKELSELKLLYGQINRTHYYEPYELDDDEDGGLIPINNEAYPKEGFDEFIARIIYSKKLRIKSLLRLNAI